MAIISSRQAVEARSTEVVPNPASASASRPSNTGPNVGLVGDQRGRLERPDLVGFAECGHRRQRRIERGRSLGIEAASVHFSAAAGQRLAGKDGVEGAIEETTEMVDRRSSKDPGVDRVDVLEDVRSAAGADELHGGLS